VATPKRQSQLYRRVPAALFVALSLLASPTAWRDSAAAEPRSLISGYHPVEGAPFFLLTDSGFTGNDIARVRIEADPSTFSQYGGVDVVVYRVPKPLEFLKGQKDLHRIQVNGDYVGEGLANTVSFLWDKWFKKSRMVFQQIFTGNARQAVIDAAPTLKQPPPASYHTRFHADPQYRVLKQFEMIDRFRYPMEEAKPIAPPADTVLAGSSSNFIEPQQGNVYVPLGKLKPGLYFVEAYVGAHRATTLVFVADTVAITKTAGKSMLVWTANRSTGKPAGNVELVWSDGNGVLASDHTGDDGIASFTRDVPEKSYTLGQDKDGGVFVSENFYYDSEIYNSKLYLFTDRPLYKPGDRVRLKVYGREFTGARDSKPVEPATVRLQLMDPSGQTLLSRSLAIDATTGGDTELTLPANAYPGGYELRFDYRDATYSAMFRVADYAEPAFDVSIRLDRDDPHVGEPVAGQVELHYPNGDPVKDATVSLDLKSQALSVTNGDPEFGARFPQKLTQDTLTVDAHGIARFLLPAAAVPSRYLLLAVAREHAIFPVSANREVILQPAPARYSVAAVAAGIGAQLPVAFALYPIVAPSATDAKAAQAQGAPAAAVSATASRIVTPAASTAVAPLPSATTSVDAPADMPGSWEAIRLEDRSRIQGALAPAQDRFDVSFPLPGAYNIFVRTKGGKLLGEGTYTIAGPTARALAGAITIQLDRTRYQTGDTAHASIVFPEPVDDALITLERDQIEHRALLSHPGDWLTLKKISPTQWQADIPVKSDYGPNITFSALYVKNGDFNFQNAGIQVIVPSIDIAIHTDKTDYRPGDKVVVDLTSSVFGKPVAATLSAGVVDDMVYTLQPEVAPSIFDFFYHPRRDSVRTTASLNFYGYDLAWSPHTSSEAKFDYNQRALKILTRPRRENIDTAAWRPTLSSDANGHASFSFIMPDSLSRWRITVRSVTADGVVGQRTASITSSKPVYLRWSGPTRMRQGDAPRVGLIVFNQQRRPLAATLKVEGVDSATPVRRLTLNPGDNFIDLPFTAHEDTQVDLLLSDVKGRTLDRLRVPLKVDASGWTSAQSVLTQASDTLHLPADARDIRLQAATGTQQAFGAIIDSLIDYPAGGVEQTASRMIPLTIAIDSVPDDAPNRVLRGILQQRLQTARGRLTAMAGPKADFAWWGDQTAGDPLLTTYAYYADWRATQRLGIDLPPEHWQHVFDTYQSSSNVLTPLGRALTLWLMQDMHLPVRTLIAGLQRDLLAQAEPPPDGVPDADTGIVLGWQGAHAGWQMSLLLWRDLTRREQMPDNAGLAASAARAQSDLQASPNPVLAALAYGLGGKPDASAVAPLLERFDDDSPTMERALALIWLQAGIKRDAPGVGSRSWTLGRGWHYVNSGGGGYWAYRPERDLASVPSTLQFAKPPASPQTYRIDYRSAYQSAAPQAPTLPVSMTRQLYRLTPTAKPGVFKVVKIGAAGTAAARLQTAGESPRVSATALSANDLYVDEITLTPQTDKQTFKFGLLEVPVPAGTEVESQRFGFQIDGLDAIDKDAKTDSDEDAPEAENGDPLLTSEGVLSADKIQQFADHYAVPIETLNGTMVIRHLIRLGQVGTFQLPAARFYRMYQPSAKAFDPAGQSTWVIK
jgi:uncharacterized protein YfaS (alpha-2-macroglobulin family)